MCACECSQMVAYVHTHIHAHTHTHMQSWKMVSATYNRSRGSKPQSAFLDLEELQETILHLPGLWRLLS